MQTIGDSLRQARERLGLTLEEAERTTRIRAQHLAALEQNDFDRLPSQVQVRGFLRNYADYLGLDSERLLRDQRGDPKTRPPTGPRQTRPAGVPVRKSGWFSSDLLVAAVIALGTLALLVWGGGRAMASLRAAAAPAGESSALLIPTATPSNTPPAAVALVPPTPTGDQPTSVASLPPLLLPSGQVNVRLLVVQRAWVRALADGKERYLGRVEPGAILDLTAADVIEVSTGNGAAFRVSWNGQDLGSLGGLDEVVTRLWTADGPITPTPTSSPTPTVTPPPSATPRPTSAPLGTG